MIARAENAVVPQAGATVTVAELEDRRPVRVRVVDRGEERLVAGIAHGWTAAAVYVAWKDDHGLQHRDWFAAGDVTRA